MNPGQEDPAGVAFAGEIVSRAIPLFWLTDLQRLSNHGFLVVSTAAKADQSRKNDRASYKETHGLSPIPRRFWFSL